MNTSNLTPPTLELVAGKYRIDRLLGRGGMGSVWEARHVELGTRVAIKFIEAQYAKSDEALSRFRNEALAAARIDSKHAIKVFDCGVVDDMPFIVMEVLNGEPLDKRLESAGQLSPVETARIIQHVSRALTQAHELGIVHRDLKPENIFIVRDEDSEICKVLDFGIAKVIDPNGQISTATKTGAVLGTPYYMSPEQARGQRGIDPRSDLWSLGVIAYRCITGVLPFDGASLGDLLVKICTTAPPAPSQIAQGVPPGFDAWVARALDREPAARFGSARELSDTLAMALGLSLTAGLPTSHPTGPIAAVFAAGATQPGPHSGARPYAAELGLGSHSGHRSGMTPAAYGVTQAAPIAANEKSRKGSWVGLGVVGFVATALGAGVVAWLLLGNPRHDERSPTPAVAVAPSRPAEQQGPAAVDAAPPPADAVLAPLAALSANPPQVPASGTVRASTTRVAPSPTAPPPTPPKPTATTPTATATAPTAAPTVKSPRVTPTSAPTPDKVSNPGF